MQNKKAEKDYKKIAKIDFSKVNYVDSIEKMINQASISHSHLVEKRMKVAFKEILSKEDYKRVLELLKNKQKSVAQYFLLEKNIQMRMNSVPSEENPLQNYMYLDLIYTPEKNVQKSVRLSYISEEEFRKQLKELKTQE